MNEVVIPSVLVPATAAAEPVVQKQNLLDLDRAGLEKFFDEVLGEKQRFRAHQVAVLQDGVLAFQRLDHHWARDHEVNQILEERTGFVHAVELLGFQTRQVHHACSHNLQASGFKAGVNLTDHVFCHCVGLDDRESAFDCHV